jgi:hypothetical protein
VEIGKKALNGDSIISVGSLKGVDAEVQDLEFVMWQAVVWGGRHTF